MSTFEIGPGLSCDLDLLIASRLLVQASSGQGKTRTIRRLLEQTHGQVQHLVIDPEGEYATLREHFDYVLAAPKGGDVVAHPRYAKRLAEELLRLGVSAILDIYELNPDDRRLFVKQFLMGMIDAPRTLWHRVLVVVDEAHVYCPEKGEATSAGAVEALATRGRKRGYCLIAATQRLAKFKKDAAAELANKLIGGTNLDIDIDRAGEELGIQKAGRAMRLRGIPPGQFWAFGRAFLHNKQPVTTPVLTLVGPIKSKHPEPGEQAAPVPPPTAKVKAILEELSSLPAEAEAREKTLEVLQKENATLRREVDHLTKNQKVEIRDAVREVRVDVPVLLDADLQKLKVVVGEVKDETDRLIDDVGKVCGALASDIDQALETVRRRLDAVASSQVGHGRAPAMSPGWTATGTLDRGTVAARVRPPAVSTNGQLSEAQQKIVDTVYELERRGLTPRIEMIARWLGIHPNGGRYRGHLRALIGEYLADDLTLIGGGAHANSDRYRRGLDGLPISDAQRAIVTVVDEAKCSATITFIAEVLGVHPNGGRFRGNVRWLKTMGVLVEHRGGLTLSEAARR